MSVSLMERAEKAEQMLNAEIGFEMRKAQMYSLIESDDEVSMTLAGESGDVYDLIMSRDALQVAKASDFIALVTCGWASPRDNGDNPDDDEIAPSQHPQRRRVRLLVLAGKDGMASCLRFSDTPDEVITDNGTATGALATALYDLLVSAKS
jgi:hypothetical protein